MLGNPKVLCPKKMLDKKIICGSKKMLVQKIFLDTKHVGPKKQCPKIQDKQKYGPKKCGVQKLSP